MVHLDSKTILGVLILFSKIITVKEGLKNLIQNPIKKNQEIESEDDSEEIYKDVDSDGEDNTKTFKKNKKEKIKEENTEFFDSQKRNPLYSNGNKAHLWELVYLKKHYNPIIRKVSNLLLDMKYEEV